MLKEKRQLFELFFMVADLVVVSLAWILAYWLRFESGVVEADKGVPPISNYLHMTLFIWLIWAFVFRRFGLYRPMRGMRGSFEFLNLLNANALAVLLFIAVTYLFREKSVPFSRLVFVYFWFFATLFTLLERGLLRYLLREIRRKGYNLRYLLLVGTGKAASDIVARMRLHRELGIQLLGCLTKTGNPDERGPGNLPVLGRYDEMHRVLEEIDVDQIVVALPLEDSTALPEILDQARDSLADLKIVPDIYRFVSMGGSIEEFEGLPVIGIRLSPLEGTGAVVKRSFDVFLSGILLIVFSPVLLVVAIVVKLTSPGPVFYAQERVSLDGTPFRIFKFRTMRTDAEDQGPGWTKRGDARITPIGRFLRATSLDELPQLVNVLLGDMSLVGPRPERPVYIKDFRKQIPNYILRHKVPAGITGWAQVNGWRGDTSIDCRIEHDLYYIENWSLSFDIKILFLTLFRVWRDRNAV